MIVQDAAAPARDASRERILDIGGMHCASCVSGVEKALKAVPGVEDASVSLVPPRARVSLDSRAARVEELIRAIEAKGYSAAVHEDAFVSRAAQQRAFHERERRVRRQNARRALLGAVLASPFPLQMALAASGRAPFMPVAVEWLLATLVLVFVGRGFFHGAWTSLRSGGANMDVLIAVGTGTAWLYSTAAWLLPSGAHGHYFEAAALVATLVMVGKWLEDRARAATGSTLVDLMSLRPPTAVRLDDGVEREVPVERLLVGDRVLVRPGEAAPADGVVVEGESELNLSLITGESEPVATGPGARVIGGAVNGAGALVLEVGAVGEDSVLAGIVRLVESAQGGKVGAQRLADRVSAVFVPVVLVLAVATLALGAWWGKPFPEALAAAIAVVVIACPCALGLAAPTALVTGIGLAARRGILIGNVRALEVGKGVDLVAFDKTGTLTVGAPRVQWARGVGGCDRDRMLRLAAAVQRNSEHPCAAALVSHAAERGLPASRARGFGSVPGMGVVATVEGARVAVGSAALMEREGVDGESLADAARDAAGTVSFVALDGRLAGAVGFVDAPRPEARAAVRILKARGMRCVMLSGDNADAARRVARESDLDEFHAALGPAAKVAWIRDRRRAGHRVSMVGDGVNDAPALAEADLGFAMGGGADVSRQSADVVLMRSDLTLVVEALELIDATRAKVRQNLFWAFFYNVVAIPVAALGYLSPAVAGGAMALSSVSVVSNSLLLRLRGRRV